MKITIEFEDEPSFNYYRELNDKGQAFDEMDNLLRGAVKHGGEIPGLPMKQTKRQSYVSVDHIREWMYRILSETKE